MSISVVVGTYGDRSWIETAQERALPSVEAQTLAPTSVHHIHGSTLASARNLGAAEASGEWLCFVDADDELDPRFIEEMTRAINDLPDGPWLLQPATLGVVNGVEDDFPVVIPRKDLLLGNYMVISTLVRTEQFLRVGGFREWPVYEDWCLWLRCFLDGADSVAVPGAIYRVHVNSEGRNNQDKRLGVKVYNEIRRMYANDFRVRRATYR